MNSIYLYAGVGLVIVVFIILISQLLCAGNSKGLFEGMTGPSGNIKTKKRDGSIGSANKEALIKELKELKRNLTNAKGASNCRDFTKEIDASMKMLQDFIDSNKKRISTNIDKTANENAYALCSMDLNVDKMSQYLYDSVNPIQRPKPFDEIDFANLSDSPYTNGLDKSNLSYSQLGYQGVLEWDENDREMPKDPSKRLEYLIRHIDLTVRLLREKVCNYGYLDVEKLRKILINMNKQICTNGSMSIEFAQYELPEYRKPTYMPLFLRDQMSLESFESKPTIVRETRANAAKTHGSIRDGMTSKTLEQAIIADSLLQDDRERSDMTFTTDEENNRPIQYSNSRLANSLDNAITSTLIAENREMVNSSFLDIERSDADVDVGYDRPKGIPRKNNKFVFGDIDYSNVGQYGNRDLNTSDPRTLYGTGQDLYAQPLNYAKTSPVERALPRFGANTPHESHNNNLKYVSNGKFVKPVDFQQANQYANLYAYVAQNEYIDENENKKMRSLDKTGFEDLAMKSVVEFGQPNHIISLLHDPHEYYTTRQNSCLGQTVPDSDLWKSCVVYDEQLLDATSSFGGDARAMLDPTKDPTEQYIKDNYISVESEGIYQGDIYNL